MMPHCAYTLGTCRIGRLDIDSYNASNFSRIPEKNGRCFYTVLHVFWNPCWKSQVTVLQEKFCLYFFTHLSIWINTCKQRGVSLITTIYCVMREWSVFGSWLHLLGKNTVYWIHTSQNEVSLSCNVYLWRDFF